MASQNEIVTIGMVTLNRIHYKGNPVLTVKQIATFHDKPENAVRNAYHQNKTRFNRGVDCFIINYDEAKTLTGRVCPNGLLLFSESGYLKLVKTFGDDKAWEIQGKLIDAYFHVKVLAAPQPSAVSPIQALLQAVQLMAEQEARVTALESRTLEIEAKLTTRTENHYTVAGYCKKHNLTKYTKAEYQSFGKQLAQLSREKGYPIEQVHDEKYGHLNSYHVDILSDFFRPLIQA